MHIHWTLTQLDETACSVQQEIYTFNALTATQIYFGDYLLIEKQVF